MKSNRTMDILLLLTLLILIGVIIYGANRVSLEGVQCIANPLGYYEEKTNTSLPFLHPNQVIPNNYVNFNISNIK